ncbi:COX15/CtaA family protein [Halobellus limi]|uniref:Cytochrome c oxidase assembly protein subunit 15 n=1 Tax=Halobellus limi TaxID=699433 RepID=A0A1H5UZD6_9EURY|nr:COX15/CtaA family protein [Halobellus limi]QCC46867.1 heme A synthase [Halobellus limi]SEF80475.1 cytochrome c oxidase assembly protein subunit 15 [Halobellus limi]
MDARLRRFVGVSAALTGILMVLGVYTAATGAGLTCAGRWPFCDGFLGLFPANWSSFVEWFHRLVAMITGFVVLGTTILAWREDADRRIRLALAGATILLPSQIVLGALTVTTYEWAILLAHFGTASIIFTGVALAAAWTYGPSRGRSASEGVKRALAVAAASLPALLVLTPHAFVTFGPPVQAAYYLLGLGAYAALLSAAVWASPATGSGTARRVRLLSAAAAAVVISLLVTGRLVYGGTLQYVSLAGGLTALALVVAAWYALRRDVGAADSRGIPGGD